MEDCLRPCQSGKLRRSWRHLCQDVAPVAKGADIFGQAGGRGLAEKALGGGAIGQAQGADAEGGRDTGHEGAELRDGQGTIVYSWTIKPPVRMLPPNEKVNFSEAKLDIPRRATQLTVSWALPKS